MRLSNLSVAVDGILAAVVVGLAVVLFVPSLPPASDPPPEPARTIVSGPIPRPPAAPPDPARVAARAAEREREEKAYQAALEKGKAAVADDPYPIPYDPAKAKALHAAALRWHTEGTVGVFDKSPRAAAPWADKARAALAAKAREMAAADVNGEIADDHRQATDAALRAAVGAGCDDPLVVYWQYRLDRTDAIASRDLVAYRDVVAAVWASPYPPVRKINAVHNLLADYATAIVPVPVDEGVWHERYWELFDAMATSGDRLAEDQLFDLIPYRVRLGVGVGLPERRRTREANRREVEAHLKAAPEYVRGTVRGSWLVADGWEARGTRAAVNVTEEGWRVLRERMEQAEEALRAAHAAAPDRPEAPTAMLSVCTGRGHDRGEMERWFRRAMLANPANHRACEAKANYLRPRWHGTPGEEAAFLWALALHPDPADGLPAVVMDAAFLIEPFHGPGFVAHRDRVAAYYADADNWAVLRAASERLLAAHPEDRAYRTAFARMACTGGRHALAHPHFVRLGRDFTRTIFPNEADYYEMADAARKAAGE